MIFKNKIRGSDTSTPRKLLRWQLLLFYHLHVKIAIGKCEKTRVSREKPLKNRIYFKISVIAFAISLTVSEAICEIAFPRSSASSPARPVTYAAAATVSGVGSV